MNNLKNIAVALHSYHSEHGHFPPAYVADDEGRPLYSWRVALLPYLDLTALYREFDRSQPWDSPHNRQASETALAVLRCPDQPRATAADSTTSYLAVVGPECAWRGAEPVSLADFEKDPAEVILVVEVADAGVPWAKPQDLDFATMAEGINVSDSRGISSYHDRGGILRMAPGVNVLFADGHVDWLPADFDPQKLREMLTVTRGRKTD